jgi:hypothetical protein
MVSFTVVDDAVIVGVALPVHLADFGQRLPAAPSLKPRVAPGPVA